MKNTWALQDAKNRLSQVVEEALSKGPQTITRRGKTTAVLLSADAFQALSTGQDDLVDFFKHSPLHGVELDIERPADFGREVSL